VRLWNEGLEGCRWMVRSVDRWMGWMRWESELGRGKRLDGRIEDESASIRVSSENLTNLLCG
jgi:hypothetical protein